MVHLLEVKDLVTQFVLDTGTVQAVDGVSFHIDEGEIVGIVGESGCGKSVTQLSILQLVSTPPGRIARGEVLFEGSDLLKFNDESEQMRSIRGGRIGMIFQEPMTSLNPVLTVGQQIIESVMLHLKLDRAAARERAIELLKLVGIPDARHRIEHYPHQFSGGMRQRAMIAMAMSCNPKLLIADEATTSLDVTTQAQLLEILRDTVKHFNTSLIIVTHNLGVVARYVQRLYVMYAGRIVESGTAKDIFGNPTHPYTIGLLRSVPRLDEPKGHRLVPIDGIPPSLIDRPQTCAFLPRCGNRTEQCEHDPWPALTLIEGQHQVACFQKGAERRAQLGVSGIPDFAPQAATIEASSLRQPEYAPPPSVKDVAARTARSPDTSSRHARITEPAADDTRDQVCTVDADSTGEALLEVQDLKMYFPVTKGLLRRRAGEVKAVQGISFRLDRGKTLGLVGESGCGKTTTARCILRLYQPTSGRILFRGTDITSVPRSTIRKFRREMSLIFQDPYGSLDPRQTAGNIVGEPLKVHHFTQSKREYRDRVAELFRMVGLDPGLAERVPHEFSGGQRQRIGIARALACEPSLIVCDEPISALDVSIQAQIINLLKDLQQQLGLTYLFIAHDLSVVRHISDRIAVMYLGQIVEIADCSTLYRNPLHPYTRALLSAVPIPDPFVEEKRERILLKGEVPSLMHLPEGCPFHPRCALATKKCHECIPPLQEKECGHQVACLQA